MSLYDLPKDMLIKLISTIKSQDKYFVVRLYHTYGDYYIETFDNEEELKKYLIEDIEEKREYLNIELEYDNDITDLIRHSKRLGKEYLEYKTGYGIVEVFKGQRL